MNKNLIPILAIIVPCYNEQAVLSETIQKLKTIIDQLIKQNKINKNSFTLFVDDGSQDQTWQMINNFHQQNPHIKGIKLSRNFGHQNALLCGLLMVKDTIDCAITIDADLQDDISLLPQFIEQFQAGHEVVYGVRKQRATDTSFKKNTALAFYKIMQWLGAKTIADHAEYRLMSQRALNELANFKEQNLFLRGIFPALGFKSTYLYYDRQPRLAGDNKYTLKKMFNFACTGITSSSTFPLRLISILGGSALLFTVIASIYFFLTALFSEEKMSHWVTMTLSLYFIGSIQLLSLGIIGEYIANIYQESKGRPRFIIEDETK